jgi:DnaA family protein
MSARQLLLGLVEAPAPTFDNFVTGRNGAALAALHALGNMPGGDRCLYFWGAPGSGRSHLLSAWRAAHAGNPGCHAVDDVHTLDDAAQVALFNRYNQARAGQGWLLVAGDLPPAQLAVRDDVKSRLAWGLGFEILPLTDDEKRAALAGRARDRGLHLGPEMIDYLMARARRDMPSLIALVDAIDRHSLETKRPVTLPMLRDLLNQNQSLPL